jgi:hypothetical protein
VLYGVNGLLPIAICLRQDMPWAGVLGFIAMAIPLGLAWRAGAPAVAAAPTRNGSLDMRRVAVAGD